MIKIASTLFDRIAHARESIFMFLQMGKIMIELEEYEFALKCYELVKTLSSPPTYGLIRKELKKFFGNYEEGVLYLVDKCRWASLRKKYE